MNKNKTTAAPATVATTTESATESIGATGAPESTAEKTEQPDSAAEEAAPKAESAAYPVVETTPVVKPTESVAKADKGSYIVASPIKHDGDDYEPGDTIRLPEAVAHRLAGYLEA